MSLSPAILDAMVASGCTAEQIAAVVKASLAEVEQAKTDKRAKDAERQREHRRRNAVSRDVTVTECDSVTEAPLPRPLSPQTPLTPTPTPGNKQPARKGLEKPDGVSSQTWADFCAHRKRLKADVTPTAIAGIRREAEKLGWSMEQALTESTTQGWRGFKADWVERRTGPPPNGSNSNQRGGSMADIGNEVRELYGIRPGN